MQVSRDRRRLVLGCSAVTAMWLSGCGARGIIRHDLAGSGQTGPRRVLVVPADFVITEITFGKTEERVVAAERRAARTLVEQVRELGDKDKSFKVVTLESLEADERETMLQHRALFATMVSQMLQVKEGAVDVWSDKARYFDYTLGAGMADIARERQIDTAIFVVGRDKVRSMSRKVLDTLNAVLPLGESLSSQPAAVVTGVVDLRSGDVLMFDADTATRKSLTNDDDVRAMSETVLSDFRRALKARKG
ncbi:hypothetical protein [uncultured Aquabacterium sp.]|uniref:hypothetical protein n=1 Tax=uncultured Aquabacterium sp. TaxID=158753 RepID=UPI002622B951|nr:hypothetical protein [uncultured Aquabacterium sp.]